MKRIAKITSYLLHPLVMPLYAILVIFWATPFALILPYRAKLFLLLIVYLSTVQIPLLFLFLLRKTGRLNSFALRERNERIVPLLFAALMYYITYMIMTNIIRLHSFFPKIFLMLTFFLLLLAVITKFWKISLHMAAMGGLVILVLHFSYYPMLLLVVIFLSGLLGTSRLLLQAHNSTQIYVGFGLGISYFSGYFLV